MHSKRAQIDPNAAELVRYIGGSPQRCFSCAACTERACAGRRACEWWVARERARRIWTRHTESVVHNFTMNTFMSSPNSPWKRYHTEDFDGFFASKFRVLRDRFAAHTVLKLIAAGKFNIDEKPVLHCVGMWRTMQGYLAHENMPPPLGPW